MDDAKQMTPGPWSWAPFSDLFEIPTRNGVTVPRGDRSQGTWMINMGELFSYSRIGDSDMARVPLTPGELEKSMVEPGDLIFARRSLKASGAGKCALVIKASEPRTFESSIIRVRLDQSIADPEFYFYFFSSSQGLLQMQTIVEQVAVAGIRSSDLAQLKVPFPDLRTQKSVAASLRTLDEKSSSNIRLIRTIPDLIRAYVVESLKPLDAQRHLSVSQIANFVNGGAFTKGATGQGRMVIRIAELTSGPGSSTVYNELDVDSNQLARPGDILLAWSGSLGVYRWARDEAIINQHIFKVIPDGFPAWLVFDRIDSALPEFRSIARDKATTMGHIQRGDLDTTKVLVPSKIDLEQLDQRIAPIWERLLVAEQENELLSRLRKDLLDGIFSGQVKLSTLINSIGGE